MLLDPRLVYAPFEYPQFYDFWFQQQTSHWLHNEINLTSDLQDWKVRLTDTEKTIIAGILKGFVQVESLVSDFWSNKVARWFKKPEICLMANCFASMEGIHQVSYAYLNETLGLLDFDAFLYEPTAKAKLDRLASINDENPSNEEMALSLAIFSAFTEGVQLFSSFAVLFNFSRFNKLKGVAEIISFSCKDESLHCLPTLTKVRTVERGFIPITDVNVGEQVFGFKDGQIVKTLVLDKTSGNHTGKMIKFKTEHFKQTVTDNHYIYTKDGEYLPVREFINKKTLNDVFIRALPLNSTDEYPISDSMLKLLVAVQADGCYSKHRPNELRFHLYKTRKIERLKKIFNELGIDLGWHQGKERNGLVKHTTDSSTFPISLRKEIKRIMPDKVFPEFFRTLSTRQKILVVEEAKHWDGSILKSKNLAGYQYCSTIQKNAYILLEMLNDIGYFPRLLTREKQNKNWNTSYTIIWSERKHKSLYNAHEYGKGKGVKSSKYDDVQVNDYPVACLTTDTSNFIIMTEEGSVELTGNSKAGCALFNQFVKEYPAVLTNNFITKIYDAASITVNLEDSFIDKVFGNESIDGISKEHIKNFIRQRANTKLNEIGFKSKFKVNQTMLNDMIWFDALTRGINHTDFFATRVTDYSKSLSFTDDIWN